MPRFDTNSNKS